MADNNLIKEKLRIVKELKEIQEKEGVNAAKLNDTYIKHLARLKEIQKELLDTNEAYKKGIESISKMGDGVASLSSVYSELKDNVAKSAETQTSISNSMAEQINRGDAISERNIRAQAVAQDIMSNYREQQSLAVELAQLDESQVTEKAKILDELGIYNQLLEEQLGTLDKRTAVGKEFMSINSELSQTTGEMVDKAKELSSLSAQQKQTLEDQAAVADTINEKFRSLEESIVSILSRPTALIGGIVAGLGKVISALGTTTREMGGFVGGITGAVGQVTLLKTVFPQALDTAKGLSSEFGGLKDLSFQTQLNTNLMAMNMGIGGQEAAALVGNFARLNGGSIETAQNLAASTKELAKANGLMPSQVMADVAGSAQAFAEYGKEGGKNIGEAAVAAGKLGVNMGTLTGVTDNLLDFESSITKELELGAMLGKNINLNKARQLAYEGQIGASVKEALNQMGGIDAFNRMDIFQKRQAAAALGLSTDQLLKMSANMDKLNDDGTMQLSTFETISETITGIATGPMGSMVTKFGVFLGGIGQAGMGLKTLGGMFPKMAAGIGRMWVGMQGMAASIWRGLAGLVMYPIQLAKSAAIGAANMLGIGGGAAKAATSVATTAATATADVVSTGAKAAKGATMGTTLTSLAAGLTAMGTPTVLFGAANLLVTGIGFTAMLPGIPGMIGVGLLGATAGAGLTALSVGLTKMATTGPGSLSLLAAAAAFTLMIPGSLGMLLLGAAAPIASAGIFALIPALTALGTAMASGVGALGLIALIGMAVGLGAAFALIGAGAMMFGKGIELASNGLGSFLPKLSTFMESISLGQVATIGLLSLAFMGLAYSLMVLGSAGLFALPALLGIAAASAGLVMVAEILGIGGESSSEETGALEEGSMSEYQKNVIQELKTLQDVMRKGLIVNLDGTRVNRGIQAAENKSLSNSAIPQ